MSSFTAMFFLGVGSAIIGAAPRNIWLSPYQIGLLFATQNIGFILSVITVGTLADSTDKARLMFAASLIIAVSIFFFYLKDSFILNLGIMLIIGVGIGGYEGAMEFYGFDQVTSKLALVAFLAGIAAGRLVLGVLARKSQLLKYILALFALTAAVLNSLLFASPATVMAYIVLIVSGATISVIFPLIIALAGPKYPEMSGTVMGIIKLGIPAGGIVVPLLLSLLVQATSFKASLVLFPAIGVAGFMLALSHRNQLTIVSKFSDIWWALPTLRYKFLATRDFFKRYSNGACAVCNPGAGIQ
jgi:fucose permease